MAIFARAVCSTPCQGADQKQPICITSKLSGCGRICGRPRRTVQSGQPGFKGNDVKRILILTAGFGDGHNAAARNVQEALEQISPDVEVTVADLYERGFKGLNGIARKAYLGVVRYAPGVYAALFKLVHHVPWLTRNPRGMGRIQRALEEVIEETRPDCVVSTYPTYTSMIAQLFQGHSEKPFPLVTIITDSGSINSAWYQVPSDHFVVADDKSAQVLLKAGIKSTRIQTLGFPVSPRFSAALVVDPAPLKKGQPFRVLYTINTGKTKAGKAIAKLLEIPNVELTVTVGRHAELKRKLAGMARKSGGALRLLGWTNQMPELLMRSHLVIGKAGGAAVQEAIAARCPMIVNQIIPGQEEGNARLIHELGIGAIGERKKEMVRWVRRAMADDGALWKGWRARLDEISKPDSAVRIARFVLEKCCEENKSVQPLTIPARRLSSAKTSRQAMVAPAFGQSARPLLCDFHIHTNYSDGRLSVPEVVDFYGSRGFDCICITDHWTDLRRLIGKRERLSPLALCGDQIEEYFDVVAREARRAWRRYNMLVMTGLEFNKEGPTPRSSVNLLGLDLQAPISPRLDLSQTIHEIRSQRGLSVASHPNLQKSKWTRETLFLWDHQEEFLPLIDAWEIGNRSQLFSQASLKRLPFLANSDFHKPKHIFSWKTLLHCEKDRTAIKECIRRNEQVGMTLYGNVSTPPAELLKVEGGKGQAIPVEAWPVEQLLRPLPVLAAPLQTTGQTLRL